MKINLTLYGLLGSLLVSSFAVSCAKETFDEQYVKLEQVGCSFYSTGNAPMEIKIKSNPAAWKAESNVSWLEVGKGSDGATLTLTAADNDSDYERSAIVTVTAGEAVQEVAVTQLGLNLNMPRYRTLANLGSGLGAAISPSGRYVGGFEATIAEDDSYVFHPVIIDVYTGEEYRNVDVPQSQFDLYQTMVMSDDGLLFIHDGQFGRDVVFDKDGNYFVVEAEGYISRPQVQGTGDGGRKWCGFAMKESDKSWTGRMYYPLVWIDGEIHELKFPDKNFRDEEFWTGIMARGMSADGRIIYGTTWDNSDFGMVYWTDINEKARYVGEDVHVVTPVVMQMSDGTEYDTHIANGMICTANLLQISPSGTWIAGSYRTEEVAENRQSLIYTQHAAFYNTETETTTIIKDYGESTGMRATDDGIAFIGLGTLGISSGVVYDLNSGTHLGTIEEWVYNNYGINVPTGVINFVNADKDVIFGTYAAASAMGVSFQNYYIAPPITE